MANLQHLPLYLKLYQLNKYLHRAVNNFPKHWKYTLGESILKLNWKCIDLLIEANILSGREKYPKVLALSTAFDCLKTRLRMAQEINLISEKQYIHIQSSHVREIGEMVGGWLKWCLNR